VNVYLVEAYASRTSGSEVEAAAERASVAAAGLSDAGAAVRHRGSIFLPDDEISFHLFEAAASRSVAEVARRAGIDLQRILPVELVGRVVDAEPPR